MSGNDDTSYKKAKRIFQHYRDEEIKIYNRYKQLRLWLNDAVNIGNNELSGFDEGNYLATNEQDAQLIKYTIENNWELSRAIWIKKIKQEFPRIAEKISSTDYEQATTWNDFIQCIYTKIEERVETEKKPFFVLKIFELAEIYFIYENHYGDVRKTTTSIQVLNLYSKGFKQVEIAKELDISKQMVSRIIKKSRE